MSLADLTKTFEAYQSAQRMEPTPTLKERKTWLRSMLSGLKTRESALLDALHEDLGKSEPEARLTEYFPIRKEIEFVLRNLSSWMRPERRPTPLQLFGTSSRIVHQPKGVVLVIAPWNFPLLLTIKPVIAALAAGNRVVVKPPEQSPATSKVMAEWLSEVIPSDRVHVVLGGPEEAAHLTSLGFDHIFFTGGTQTGQKVMRAASHHLTSLTLELGGKSPAIVDASASPKKVAGRIGWGKALNSGQVCIAPDYLLVEKSAEEALLLALIETWQSWFGAQAETSKEYGRVVNEAQFERLITALNDATSKGAVVRHGGRYDRSQLFMEPTILTGVTLDMIVMQEEIFGPLLPVVTWIHPEEVSDWVAAVKDQPLAMYMFSRHKKRIEQWLASTRSGSVGIGETVVQIANPDLPFGGIRSSGMGRSNGRAAFDAFSNKRSVMTRTLPWTAVPLSFPPFGPAKSALVRWLSRRL